MDIKVSMIASAVRKEFYKTFLDSLKSTTVAYEVVFAGNNTPEEIVKEFKDVETFTALDTEKKPVVTVIPSLHFRYIHTANIKPAQCYEIARRYCIGETIQWTADDCIYSKDLIGDAYRYWSSLNNRKAILSIQTIENGQYCDMKVHSFFGCQFDTPLMAPLGLMSKQYSNELGGFDRRYVCGQYENTIVMEAIADGGFVKVFGNKHQCITIDHYKRHGIIRPFATGYNHDRSILEGSWTDGNGKVSLTRNDKHEPYEDKDLLTISQSHKGQWQ